MPSGHPNQQTIPIFNVCTAPVGVVVLVVEVVVVEVVVVEVVVVEVVDEVVVVLVVAQPKIPTSKAETTSMLPRIHNLFVSNLIILLSYFMLRGHYR